MLVQVVELRGRVGERELAALSQERSELENRLERIESDRAELQARADSLARLMEEQRERAVELENRLERVQGEVDAATEEITAEVQKKLSQLSSDASEQASRAADEAKAKASGGETKRAKLDRLFAMDAEAKPLIEHLGLELDADAFARAGGKAPMRVYGGTLPSGAKISVVCAGSCVKHGVCNVGTVGAALSTYETCVTLKPDVIVNAGTAGISGVRYLRRGRGWLGGARAG